MSAAVFPLAGRGGHRWFHKKPDHTDVWRLAFFRMDFSSVLASRSLLLIPETPSQINVPQERRRLSGVDQREAFSRLMLIKEALARSYIGVAANRLGWSSG